MATARKLAKVVDIKPAEDAANDNRLSDDTVNEATVEALIESKALGDRIRKLRLKRSMGLVELGRHTGLSASFLSQLETGRVIPTLRNISRIAMVFNKDLAYFFGDPRSNQLKVSRAADRIRLRKGGDAAPDLISESMSALIPDRSVVPCVAEFPPGTDRVDFVPTVFAGLELLYIMAGSLCVNTENGSEQLEQGDSAWIDGRGKRKYRCGGKDAAKALIISFHK